MSYFCAGFATSALFLVIPLSLRYVKDAFRAGISFSEEI